MNDFKKLNYIDRRQLSIEQLVKYYAEYRIYCYNKKDELKGIELRKKMHFLINLILETDRKLSKEENIIIANDNKASKTEPKIFACTHIGGNDIQRTFQVIKEPAYLMLGDPGILYRKLIYQGLKLNGVIPLETKNKQDRKVAYNRSLELLKKGGNLLIYPEGAWNVSPNELVMKTFVGTVRMAKEAGVPIVPIAVEQYENKFLFNIGQNYGINKNTNKTEKELNIELRDKLATLKWQILETQLMLKRKDVPNDYLFDFQDQIIQKCNYGYGFSLEDALSERFHDKNIVSEDEVYKFMKHLDINKNNAFLLRNKPKI